MKKSVALPLLLAGVTACSNGDWQPGDPWDYSKSDMFAGQLDEVPTEYIDTICALKHKVADLAPEVEANLTTYRADLLQKMDDLAPANQATGEAWIRDEKSLDLAVHTDFAVSTSPIMMYEGCTTEGTTCLYDFDYGNSFVLANENINHENVTDNERLNALSKLPILYDYDNLADANATYHEMEDGDFTPEYAEDWCDWAGRLAMAGYANLGIARIDDYDDLMDDYNRAVKAGDVSEQNTTYTKMWRDHLEVIRRTFNNTCKRGYFPSTSDFEG